MNGAEADAERLTRAVATADAILDLVAREAPAGVTSRDRNDQLLVLGFGRAFRCFRSIRDVAAVHAEADDAYALTRALFVILLQSLWIATPEDPEERLRRGRAIELAGLVQIRKQTRSMAELGMGPPAPAAVDRRIEELQAAGLRPLPPDEVIARELGEEIIALYAHVYRTASDVAHYSLFTALQGFAVTDIDAQMPEGFDGVRVRFQDGNLKRAEEALILATLLYVSFLERTEFVVHHGTFERAQACLMECVGQRLAGTRNEDELLGLWDPYAH